MCYDALLQYVDDEDANFNTYKLPDQLMADSEGKEVVAPQQKKRTAKKMIGPRHTNTYN